jgi:hypothetical protein
MTPLIKNQSKREIGGELEIRLDANYPLRGGTLSIYAMEPTGLIDVLVNGLEHSR